MGTKNNNYHNHPSTMKFLFMELTTLSLCRNIILYEKCSNDYIKLAFPFDIGILRVF